MHSPKGGDLEGFGVGWQTTKVKGKWKMKQQCKFYTDKDMTNKLGVLAVRRPTTTYYAAITHVLSTSSS